MIVRRFSATASTENAPKYYAFFKEDLTPQLRDIPGHRGALILSETSGDAVEITVLTFWESREAIARFAGDTPDRAVVEPEARAILRSFDDRVAHLRVEVDTVER